MQNLYNQFTNPTPKSTNPLKKEKLIPSETSVNINSVGFFTDRNCKKSCYVLFVSLHPYQTMQNLYVNQFTYPTPKPSNPLKKEKLIPSETSVCINSVGLFVNNHVMCCLFPYIRKICTINLLTQPPNLQIR